MHSKKFYKVKDYYDRGLWDKSRVENAVFKGWITTAEQTEILEGTEAETTEETTK